MILVCQFCPAMALPIASPVPEYLPIQLTPNFTWWCAPMSPTTYPKLTTWETTIWPWVESQWSVLRVYTHFVHFYILINYLLAPINIVFKPYHILIQPFCRNTQTFCCTPSKPYPFTLHVVSLCNFKLSPSTSSTGVVLFSPYSFQVTYLFFTMIPI